MIKAVSQPKGLAHGGGLRPPVATPMALYGPALDMKTGRL